MRVMTWRALSISPLSLISYDVASNIHEALHAGMEVMKYAPLETFITVKSMTPVLFCVCEYLFLGRALPNLKSVGALAGIVGGAMLYVRVDEFASFKAELGRSHRKPPYRRLPRHSRDADS